MPSPIIDVNWLEYRGAGALFNLQKTPYDFETVNIGDNPKRDQKNKFYENSRVYLPEWPSKSVYKIRHDGFNPPAINALQLEVTSKLTRAITVPYDVTDEMVYSRLTGATPAYVSSMWVDGDDNAYATADFAVNRSFEADLGDGTKTYYEIYKWTTGWVINSRGNWQNITSSYEEYALEEENFGGTGVEHVLNGMWPEGSGFSVFAKFHDKIDANAYLDSYETPQDILDPVGNVLVTKFCPRHSSDDPHGLSQYTYFLGTTNEDTFRIRHPYGFPVIGHPAIAYKPLTDAQACGAFMRYTSKAQWYYTPNACEDCWYKDKVITVEIKYKQAQVTVEVAESGAAKELKSTATLGSWSAHSTVTQTLTLPGGHTRQAINDFFTVPQVEGYVVVIDDIKLVSVA